jgi:hypothetical protein
MNYGVPYCVNFSNILLLPLGSKYSHQPPVTLPQLRLTQSAAKFKLYKINIVDAGSRLFNASHLIITEVLHFIRGVGLISVN